jgi:hypothetical protein
MDGWPIGMVGRSALANGWADAFCCAETHPTTTPFDDGI